MKKIQYLSSFFVAFILGIFVMNNFVDFDVANSISSRKGKKEEHYQDEKGNIGVSKDDYLEHDEDDYYVAPDGAIGKMNIDMSNR